MLLVLVLVLGGIIYLARQFIGNPWQKVITVVCVIIILVALLKFLFTLTGTYV